MLGPASAGGVGAQGRSGPNAPTHRPTWLLVLSSITLFYGGLMLVSGLTALRNPASVAKLPATRPLPPEEEALMRELATVTADVLTRHAGAIRARAAASMVLALLMLYSAAAALSRDRHGRRANLIAAWLGIVYQVGTLPLVLPIASDWAAATSPIWSRVVANQMAAADKAPSTHTNPATGVTPAPPSAARDAAPNATSEPATVPDLSQPETLATVTKTVYIGFPIVYAILGVLGSLLIIGYFGGRRGRALYGLPPRR